MVDAGILVQEDIPAAVDILAHILADTDIHIFNSVN